MQLFDATRKKFKLASITKAKTLIKSGFVRVNGVIISRPDTEVRLTDEIELLDHAERRPKKLPFEILFEDESILVTCKPAGKLVEDFCKLIQQYRPVILTHRLDQKVSGIMIFAKSRAIEQKLEADWANNEKIYIALVEAKPAKKEGKIESFLAEGKDLKVYSTIEGPGTKHAVTYYKTLPSVKGPTRLEVRLETGRKNQIRVHLSDIGCPIVGDLKYGAKTSMRSRIALHAALLSFKHPVTFERMTFRQEAPF